MRKVAVVFGGRSCENEISVLTGIFALNVLDRAAYELLPVYAHTDGGFYTSPKMFSLEVFRGGRCEKFQQIFFDKGTVYALNAKKGRVKPCTITVQGMIKNTQRVAGATLWVLFVNYFHF